MALAKCPHCNSDVSDIAEKCPKCGAQLKTNIDCEDSGRKNIAFAKLLKALILVLCLAVVIRIIMIALQSRLDETEQYVCDCVQDLANREGDIVVDDDMVYVVYKDKVFVIISFDGDRAYYCDKSFLGKESEYQRIKDKRKSDYSSSSEYSEVLYKQKDFAEANVAYASANLMHDMGVTSESYRFINAEKICKKLHISYW